MQVVRFNSIKRVYLISDNKSIEYKGIKNLFFSKLKNIHFGAINELEDILVDIEGDYSSFKSDDRLYIT